GRATSQPRCEACDSRDEDQARARDNRAARQACTGRGRRGFRGRHRELCGPYEFTPMPVVRSYAGPCEEYVKNAWVEPHRAPTGPMEKMPISSAFCKSPTEPDGANNARLFLRLGGKLQRIAFAATGFRSARGLGLGDVPGVDGDHAHP